MYGVESYDGNELGEVDGLKLGIALGGKDGSKLGNKDGIMCSTSGAFHHQSVHLIARRAAVEVSFLDNIVSLQYRRMVVGEGGYASKMSDL